MAGDMRTLGYICPKCGAPVMGARSIFALEASDAEIACSCGGSVLHTSFDGQRYRLLVPCGVCGKIHEAVCPPERIRETGTPRTLTQEGKYTQKEHLWLVSA